MKSYLQLFFRIKILLVFISFSGLASHVFAQHTVTGTVVDAASEDPLPGVSILIQGTDRGTATAADGTFELDAPSGDATLIFSFVGFERQEVPIQGRSELNIEMNPAEIVGEELVVVGYGIQRAEDVTGAISSISAEDFIVSSPRDAASLIRGRVAGLNVAQPTGNPTAGTDITLRGTTTLTADASPLVLIDGVPGDLNTVAPEEIESINVLKDGSAAAIYGSRGTNGVILITTKRHDGVQPVTISYEGYTNYQRIVNVPNFFDADGYRNAIQEFDAGFQDFGESTDWLSHVLRDNPVGHSHTLRLSGGDDRTNYTGSISYLEQQGLFERSNNERLRGRVNLRHSMFDDRLAVNLNLNYLTQEHFNGSRGEGSFNNDIWFQSLIRNPTDRLRIEDGTQWQERPTFNYNNPVALLQEVDGTTENRELRLNGSVLYSPIDNLSLELMAATTRWSHLRGHSESFLHNSTTVAGINGWASRNTESITDELIEFTATYEGTIDNHNYTILGGYSWQEVVEEGFNAQNQNFPSDQFTFNNLGIGADLEEGLASMGSFKNSRKLIGFFSRINYTYDQRYMIMGSVRYEGDSRFGADHEWGLFPAVSLGWRISNESFMDDLDFINDLRFRGGFGVTGISPDDPYLSLASFGFGGFFLNRGNWIRGIEPVRNPNPDLRWERKDEFNVGVDFELFGRLSGNVDLYQRNTRDLLFNVSVPVPPNLFGNQLVNIGELKNEGLEIALEYAAFQRADFSWRTGINYSTNRSELVSLSSGDLEADQSFVNAGGLGESVQLPTHRLEIGGEVGNFYGFKAVGITEDGQWIIEGEGGEEKTWLEISPEDDRQVIGNGIPNHNLAWNNSFRYRNFDMEIYLRGAFDFQVLNETRLFYENPNQLEFNLLETAFHDVFGERQLNNEWAYTDYYLEDGDFVKIDNITIGYTLPVSGLGISNARVYVSADNLYTFTSYSGQDPEVNISGLAPGHEFRNRFPLSRTFTLGVNLRF